MCNKNPSPIDSDRFSYLGVHDLTVFLEEIFGKQGNCILRAKLREKCYNYLRIGE